MNERRFKLILGIEEPRVFHVGLGCQFIDVQHAINSAADGDTIYIHGQATCDGTINIDRAVTVVATDVTFNVMDNGCVVTSSTSDDSD